MDLSKLDIDFIGQRWITLLVSVTLLAVSIGALVVNGLRFGIDFTGGTLLEVRYEQPVELSNIREILRQENYGDAIVQHFGTTREVLIRVPLKEGTTSADLSNRIMDMLNAPGNPKAEKLRVEFVGPQVGDELAEDGGLAMLYAMFGILIYVAWRFEYKFAVGSVMALVHDVVITLGYFALFGREFDLTVLAAVLAVIGYSLNDTIVVYDRIRENFRKMRKGTVVGIMNAALNQTLSRTMMTGVTTLIVLVALAVLGGETIHNFSIALIVGILVGTYSSIYIATPIVLGLGLTHADLILPEKEGDRVDQRP